MDLAEFLLARLDEDESAARAAFADLEQRTDDGRWEVPSNYGADEARIEGVGIIIYDEGGHDREQALHVARHDPARVLAECDAKKAIVELFSSRDEAWAATRDVLFELLALPYNSHPDYQESWRP